METQSENSMEGAAVTRYFNPIPIFSESGEMIHQIENYDEVYEPDDDEWYSAQDFLSLIECGLHWDHGGIVKIHVDGKPTNLHAGIWMLNKENEESESVTIGDLVYKYKNVQILWANK
jgi:hypothetical protein